MSVLSKKILVVDDEANIVNAIKMILESEGFWVEVDNKGENVWKIAQTVKPDLIILDMVLGNIDGCQEAQVLKSNENTQKIPIVMISAHHGAEEKCLKAGANHFLAKPFNIDDILGAVERYT